jgi:hypothetical protein
MDDGKQKDQVLWRDIEFVQSAYISQSIQCWVSDNSNYCSEAAECFAFAVLSTAKAKLFTFAYFASRAKRAVNAQYILRPRVISRKAGESGRENLLTMYFKQLYSLKSKAYIYIPLLTY